MHEASGSGESERVEPKTRKIYNTLELYAYIDFLQINSRAVERDIYDGSAGLEKLGLWVKANL